ncbi:MAG: hypothetical protein HWE21_00915 [Cytophagia bacterium]|nr:hypothetical protein [Cytophagia bacterium]
MAKFKGLEKIKEGSSKDFQHYSNYFFECISGTPLSPALKDQLNDNYIPWDSTPEGHKAFKRFESDYKSFLIENKTSLAVVEAYLLEIYVNGIYKMRLQFENLANVVLTKCFKGDFSIAIENIYFYDLSNRVHGYGTLSSNLKGFVKSTFKIDLPSIDSKLYNIKGDYFGIWKLTVSKELQSKPTKNKPTFKSLGVFCQLLNESHLDRLESNETQEEFTKRICFKFGFDWSDNVRQAFGRSKNNRDIKNVEKYILTLLPESIQPKLESYINTLLK